MSVKLAATVKFVDIPDEFTADAKIMGNRELEEKYGKSEATIVRWRRAVKVPSPVVYPHGFSRYSFPDPQTKDYKKDAGVFRIDDDCIIASDWHVPYHDIELAEKLIRVGEKRKIKQLVIPGDLIDAAMYSRFDPHDIEQNMKDEFTQVAHVLTHLTKWFPHIYIGLGNHDLRVLRQTKFAFALDDIVQWITNDPGVHVTPLPWMILSNDGDPYHVEHPGTYSRIAGRTPSILADLLQSNVMCGHNHLIGRTRSASGVYDAVDLGGLFHKDKLAYQYVAGRKTNPIPQSGFWTLKGGILEQFTLRTRWDTSLGEKKAA